MDFQSFWEVEAERRTTHKITLHTSHCGPPKRLKNVSKTSLTAKVTVKNAFADLGKHTHGVRNAFAKAIGGGSVLIG